MTRLQNKTAIAVLYAIALPALAILFHAPKAVAQQAPTCADFERRADGMWHALKPMQISGPNGSVTFSPGMWFRPGAAFMGIDLGTVLEQRCPH